MLTKTKAGLVVSADAVSKAREVWTDDEARLMRRVINLLIKRDIRCVMICQECQAGAETLQQVAIVVPLNMTADGNLVWSCGHKERIMGEGRKG